MTNSQRGSVALQAGGTAYTISFSINALCELEDVFGMPPSKVSSLFEDEEKTSMKDIRKLIMVSLHDHHPDVDENRAGVIGTAAGIGVTMEAIGKAFSLAFPEAKAGSGNPRKAKASAR
ncbi:hypothetical protein EDE05_12820 [Neorhizobium sp. R1-B]|uniref:hypothetical protein n=1 Tax=Neorhizobium sp. R1-B TaxID=2485162 RepID=UPI0010660B74|nr:hypothetical protein [Neorhizobium sp. R1-B]TDX72599.1 hypothetical protein EDE05_12820 [Neorhizobium sp. R1-B]